jgi:hypothetical protein
MAAFDGNRGQKTEAELHEPQETKDHPDKFVIKVNRFNPEKE